MRIPKILLPVTVAALAVACVVSVCRPIRMETELRKREAEVKRRLLLIRDAEQRCLEARGAYTSSWPLLIDSFGLESECEWIPYTDGVSFELKVSDDVALSGERLPLMECSATYDAYMRGLNRRDVQQLIRQAESKGRFPGLKIGDITKPNNNATNWQ